MRLLLFVVLLVSVLVFSRASFDWALGNTSVSLSANAYCEVGDYTTRTYTGYSKGFVALQGFEEPTYDTQGYIGVMPSQKAVYVIFRGSTSITDWVDNLDAILTDYPYCSKCEVHAGFYKTEVKAYPLIYGYLKPILAKYPGYQLIITGHSLGAAMATLFSMDLIEKEGLTGLKMINFGSPRVGNDQFAEYVSNHINPRSRVTHHKDMVPHVPMHERFTHISGEYYQDDSGLHDCSGYEDPKCSYQWHITSIDDHMHYLGIYMGCGS